MASFIAIHLGALAYSMATSSSAVDCQDLPHYAVVQYIEHYGTCLDGHHFAALRLAGDTKEIRIVRTGRLCDTTVGLWITRWWHWGGRSETDSLCHYWGTDTPFVRCFE